MKSLLAIAVVVLISIGCTAPPPTTTPPTVIVGGTIATSIAPPPTAASTLAPNTDEHHQALGTRTVAPTIAAATKPPTVPPTAAPTNTVFIPTKSPPTAVPPNSTSDTLAQATQLLYERFNQERAAKNAPPLIADPTLETLAHLRSRDMLTRDYFSHQDPATGADLITPLLQQYNYPAGFWGENLVTVKGRQLDAASLAQYFANSWLASPGHAENILNPNYKHTGIGIEFQLDNLQTIATQIFAE